MPTGSKSASPKGGTGGGTVMVWDTGTYTAAGDGDDPDEALREGYRKGDFKFVLHGKRLNGSWVLVRTKGWGDRAPTGSVAPDQAPRRRCRSRYRPRGQDM